MKKDNYIFEVLRKLTDEKIEYYIIRDYIPLENIVTSADIDIYVSPNSFKKTKKILKKLGWYYPRINTSRYPHKQFIYIHNGFLYKLDIVTGLYYGEKLLELNYNYNLSDINIIDGIQVANYELSLKLLLLHIIFDKQELSDKNKLVFEKIYSMNVNKNNTNSDIYNNIALSIYNNKINILNFERLILKNKVLKASMFRFVFFKIKTKANNIARNFLKKISNKSLSIVGIDGSGKSSTIKMLYDKFNKKITVQYMGFKDYESKMAKFFYANKKENLIFKVLEIFIVYYEMWCRYFKNRFSNKLTIYDRYVHEAYHNNVGILKILFYLLYKVFFPKPKKTIYLYCPAEISLSRKNDIIDIDGFFIKKKKTDKIYLEKKGIYKFDTSKLSSEEVLEEIYKIINKEFLKYFI